MLNGHNLRLTKARFEGGELSVLSLSREAHRLRNAPAPHLHTMLGTCSAPIIAASDYVCAVPEAIRPLCRTGAATPRWEPAASAAATRAQRCAHFFGVDAVSIRAAVKRSLAPIP